MPTNPYAAIVEGSATSNASPTTPKVAFLASCVGSYVAIFSGQAACWIRLGWLERQMEISIGYWHLPSYFWFHAGCFLATSLVVAILSLPATMARRSRNLGFMLRTYGLCTLVTVGYEVTKAKDLIEPGTYSIIALVCIYLGFMINFTVHRKTYAENLHGTGLPNA